MTIPSSLAVDGGRLEFALAYAGEVRMGGLETVSFGTTNRIREGGLNQWSVISKN